MPNPTFNVYVDLNSDNDYADSGEDISAYVMSAEWMHGFAGQYDPVARDSTATIVLKNSDKRFSPESGSVFSANWTRGKKIKITSTDPADATVRTMYVGWIQSIKPDGGTLGPRRCTVSCTSFFQRAQAVESFVPLQESKTADVVIAAILGGGSVYPPGLPNRWLLGVPGYGELGETTTLGAVTDYLSAETGVTTFNYIGDQWRDGVSMLGALRDTAMREYGRIWLSRAGLLCFKNRHSLILDTTDDDSFSNTMMGMQYEYGSEVINKITVRARPRKVGASPEVLGRIDKPFVVKAGQSKVVSFRYADLLNSGAKIAGRNAIVPVQTTDFTANAAEDGSGTNYTSSVTALISSEAATRCTVTYTNAAAVDVYVIAAQIRGTAIRDFGEMDSVHNNTTSQETYGLWPYTYPGQMDNETDASQLADYIGTSRSTARGQLKSISIGPRRSAAMLTSGLARTVFDRIAVTETQTGVASDYFIISEKHSAAGKDYRVTWGLEPAGSYDYWILGVSTLGEHTYLGPL